MRLKILSFFCILFLSLFPAAAQPYVFDFNDRCEKAYNSLTSLKLQEGMTLLEQEKKENSDNLIPVFLENYYDFLHLLLNGSTQDYNNLKKNQKVRLDLLGQGPKDDPWQRYTRSAVYFQWAIIHLFNDHYLSTTTAFRSSFQLLKQNRASYPNFEYNNVLYGLEESIVGTIPSNYQWLVNLMGMRGNVKGGYHKLSKFVNQKNIKNQILRNEATFYYAFIRFYLLSDKKGTRQFIKTEAARQSGNLLLRFLEADFALNDNDASRALQLLRSRPKGGPYLSVPLFDYQAGIAALRLLDASCPTYFKHFIQQQKNNLFQKSAYQKLSYYYLATGNQMASEQYRRKILRVGNELTDADKQAQNYANQSRPPYSQPKLLRAELLSDAGKYNSAQKELATLSFSQLSSKDEQTAYYYRKGKVAHQMNQRQVAIINYQKAINLGSQLNTQFAARSALDLGQLYEQSGQKALAGLYYKKCLQMKNKDFKANLDQKAKAGLERIK